MANLTFSSPGSGAKSDGDLSSEKPARPRGLLPQAMEELQLSVEELRVAEEEMRVQNEELSRSRLRLEAERQRYQDLFEFAPDGYLVTDLEGVILEANRAAARLLNISPRFLRKRGLGTLIASHDLSEFQTRLLGLTTPSAEPAGEWIVQMRRRPSGRFPAAITAMLFGGLLGEPPTLRWLVRDIAERIQAEEARAILARVQAERAEAEEAGRRTKEILESVTDMQVALDQDWRIVSLNGSSARVLESAGHEPSAIIGRVLWEAYPLSQGQEFQAETMQAVQAGQRVDFETYSDGLKRWFQVRVFPQENGVALYSQDITERKEHQAALEASYARERRIAETLQQILLHTSPGSVFPGLEIETFYEAASDEALVGGDFSDVFTYDSGKIALVVGDVSGKGLKAASMIAEVKFALRTILREYPWPETALARLNNFVCEAQHQGDFGSEYQVVVSLALFDPDTVRLSYATAGGSPLPVLRANGALKIVGASGLLLGVQSHVEYVATEIQLASGDTVMIATDGLSEARRGQERFGFEALSAKAASLLPDVTLQDGGRALIEAVRGWASGHFEDNVCLLLAYCP